MNEKKRHSFSGKLGFVLSAAGASVGLGNIWRFPYLAAQYGGGIFLLVYIILAVTFGYTMIMSESAIGRMTKKSPVGAFRRFGNSIGIKTGGWINAIIPLLIVPYYSVIGGWVVKYLFAYITEGAQVVTGESYFTDYLANAPQQVIWFVVFIIFDLVIIYFGVQNGIERVSKMVMPVLAVLAVVLAGYSMTLPGALEGVKYFLIPDFSNFSWMTVVAALGQMFYSLSIAMGILITFGSYMKKETDMESSTVQVEIFDTIIAVLAGLMIIPAVFAFSGGDPEALQSGPSLMFITMPKIFDSIGGGRIVGILFFVLVFFAALTSAIALTECGVATFEDEYGWSRKKATVIMGIIMASLGILTCLGFNVLSFVSILGMGILDFFDFITNSVMMPIAALLICILVLKRIGIEKVEDEVMSTSKFKRRGLYRFVLKYLAIPLLLVILVSSIANAFGIIHI
ncbi:MAG: sodium-dependent transporter [Lachnospiraceae bacterium]|nr:sodium-dependent transporter [Lachnospiraceae bacterium]